MQAGTTYSAVVGGVLKRLREGVSLNQGEMAERMGLTQAAWSNLETGKSALTTTQLVKVAEVLEIEAHQIIKYADQTVAGFKENGIEVTNDSKEAESIGLMLLGAAAIAALVATIILSKK